MTFLYTIACTSIILSYHPLCSLPHDVSFLFPANPSILCLIFFWNLDSKYERSGMCHFEIGSFHLTWWSLVSYLSLWIKWFVLYGWVKTPLSLYTTFVLFIGLLLGIYIDVITWIFGIMTTQWKQMSTWTLMHMVNPFLLLCHAVEQPGNWHHALGLPEQWFKWNLFW